MTPHLFKIPLMALALSIGLSMPAFAEKGAADAKPGMEKRHDGHHKGKKMGMPMSEEDIERVEKMDAAGRDSYFKQRREEYKNMSPEQRKELREKRKAWFDSLSAEKKEALKERHKKIREEFVARKKAEFEKLSPEEQAKIKAKREDRMKERKERREDRKDDNDDTAE